MTMSIHYGWPTPLAIKKIKKLKKLFQADWYDISYIKMSAFTSSARWWARQWTLSKWEPLSRLSFLIDAGHVDVKIKTTSVWCHITGGLPNKLQSITLSQQSAKLPPCCLRHFLQWSLSSTSYITRSVVQTQRVMSHRWSPLRRYPATNYIWQIS